NSGKRNGRAPSPPRLSTTTSTTRTSTASAASYSWSGCTGTPGVKDSESPGKVTAHGSDVGHPPQQPAAKQASFSTATTGGSSSATQGKYATRARSPTTNRYPSTQGRKTTSQPHNPPSR